MNRRIVALLTSLTVAACSPEPAPDGEPTAKSPPSTLPVAESRDARTMRLWARSCALCHVDGNAGAPRIGNEFEWGPRLAQGNDVLLEHTVEGLNSMPPLGYCMACEREDFLAMIDLMTSGINADAEPAVEGSL